MATGSQHRGRVLAHLHVRAWVSPEVHKKNGKMIGAYLFSERKWLV